MNQMTDQELNQLLRDARITKFSDHFPDRVIERIRHEKKMEAEWISALWLRFRQVAAVAIILAIGFGIYNLRQSTPLTTRQSPIESIIGLPPVSLESVFNPSILSELP